MKLNVEHKIADSGKITKAVNDILPPGVKKIDMPVSFLEKETKLKNTLDELADDIDYKVQQLREKLSVALHNLDDSNEVNSGAMKDSLASIQDEAAKKMNDFIAHYGGFAESNPEFHKMLQEFQAREKLRHSINKLSENMPAKEKTLKELHDLEDQIDQHEALANAYRKFANSITNILIDEDKYVN